MCTPLHLKRSLQTVRQFLGGGDRPANVALPLDDDHPHRHEVYHRRRDGRGVEVLVVAVVTRIAAWPLKAIDQRA